MPQEGKRAFHLIWGPCSAGGGTQICDIHSSPLSSTSDPQNEFSWTREADVLIVIRDELIRIAHLGRWKQPNVVQRLPCRDVGSWDTYVAGDSPGRRF